MCGIVGIADFSKNAIGSNEFSIFQQMLIAGSARGMDGTGIIKVHTSGNMQWRKQVGDPLNLLNMPATQKKFIDPMIKSEFVRWLIGHNRYATTGEYTNACAHPFTQGPITLVHNGTISNSASLPEMKKFKVDSDMLCSFIANDGIEKALEKAQGPYSLVYFDSTTKTVNFIRNAGRPMFIGVDTFRNLLMFGSERKMLEWIADRNNLTGMKFEPTAIECLYTYDLDNIKPTVKSYAPKYYNSYNEYGDWHPSSSGYGFYRGAESSTYTPPTTTVTPALPAPPAKTAEASKEVQAEIERSAQYIPILKYCGYQKGADVVFQIRDYEQSKKDTSRYNVFGSVSSTIPEVEVKCSLKTAKLDDTLLKSKRTVGKIVAMVSDRSVPKIEGLYKVIFWVTDVEALPDPVEEEDLTKDDKKATTTFLSEQGFSIVGS